VTTKDSYGFDDIDPQTCTRCGVCVSICPIGVLAVDDEGVHLQGECIRCGLCYRFCPGRKLDLDSLGREYIGDAPSDALSGRYRGLYAARATSEEIRQKAASGGVVTALLVYLLGEKRINGALGVTMDSDRPWRCQPAVLRSVDEIIGAAQSKYSLVSLGALLRSARRDGGPLALVGLPCHVHGLRHLQRIGSYRETYPLVIGLFCGFNLQPAATQHLVHKVGYETRQVSRLEYRGGPWPGGLVVQTTEGQRRFVPKDSYGYVNLMYTPRRCLVCPDLTNELADLSVGDTWLTEYAGGWSTVICRSAEGEKLLDEAVHAGVVRRQKITREQLQRSHAHLFAYKKEGYFVRRKWLHVPLDYKVHAPSVSVWRWLQQTLLLALILVLSNPMVRRAAQRLPLSWLGGLSRAGRTAVSHE
jgi:coenzyme F420 hydrogenase subunit beta